MILLADPRRQRIRGRMILLAPEIVLEPTASTTVLSSHGDHSWPSVYFRHRVDNDDNAFISTGVVQRWGEDFSLANSQEVDCAHYFVGSGTEPEVQLERMLDLGLNDPEPIAVGSPHQRLEPYHLADAEIFIQLRIGRLASNSNSASPRLASPRLASPRGLRIGRNRDSNEGHATPKARFNSETTNCPSADASPLNVSARIRCLLSDAWGLLLQANFLYYKYTALTVPPLILMGRLALQPALLLASTTTSCASTNRRFAPPQFRRGRRSASMSSSIFWSSWSPSSSSSLFVSSIFAIAEAHRELRGHHTLDQFKRAKDLDGVDVTSDLLPARNENEGEQDDHAGTDEQARGDPDVPAPSDVEPVGNENDVAGHPKKEAFLDNSAASEIASLGGKCGDVKVNPGCSMFCKKKTVGCAEDQQCRSSKCKRRIEGGFLNKDREFCANGCSDSQDNCIDNECYNKYAAGGNYHDTFQCCYEAGHLMPAALRWKCASGYTKEDPACERDDRLCVCK